MEPEQPHEKVARPVGKIFVSNFLGGIAWGLGVTVGLSIVFGILGFVISKVDVVPIIGDFMQRLTQGLVEQGRPKIQIQTGVTPISTPTPTPTPTEGLTPTLQPVQ